MPLPNYRITPEQHEGEEVFVITDMNDNDRFVCCCPDEMEGKRVLMALMQTTSTISKQSLKTNDTEDGNA